jgi:hypothetical protein
MARHRWSDVSRGHLHYRANRLRRVRMPETNPIGSNVERGSTLQTSHRDGRACATGRPTLYTTHATRRRRPIIATAAPTITTVAGTGTVRRSTTSTGAPLRSYASPMRPQSDASVESSRSIWTYPNLVASNVANPRYAQSPTANASRSKSPNDPDCVSDAGLRVSGFSSCGGRHVVVPTGPSVHPSISRSPSTARHGEGIVEPQSVSVFPCTMALIDAPVPSNSTRIEYLKSGIPGVHCRISIVGTNSPIMEFLLTSVLFGSLR